MKFKHKNILFLSIYFFLSFDAIAQFSSGLDSGLLVKPRVGMDMEGHTIERQKIVKRVSHPVGAHKPYQYQNTTDGCIYYLMPNGNYQVDLDQCQGYEPDTSITLDDSYNNIGSNPSTITIDGKEGQDGHLNFNLIGDRDFNIYRHGDVGKSRLSIHDWYVSVGSNAQSFGTFNVTNDSNRNTRAVYIEQRAKGIGSYGLLVHSLSNTEPAGYFRQWDGSAGSIKAETQLCHYESSIGSNWFYRDIEASKSPLVFIEQRNTKDAQSVLYVQNNGTGRALVVENNSTGNSLAVNTSEFVVVASGNVGIGTDNPGQELTLVGEQLTQSTAETVHHITSSHTFPTLQISSTGTQPGRHPMLSYRDGTAQLMSIGSDIDKKILTMGKSINDDF